MYFTVQHPIASVHESLTVTNAVKTLTAANYKSESTSTLTVKTAARALITVEGDQIRWTCDGTAPSTTAGHRANVDDVITLEGFDAIRLFKAHRVTTDATLKVSYFGA